jgi:hypothetical protein
MKMIAFWDRPPCSLIEVDRRFRGAYCDRPDEGGSTHFGNVDCEYEYYILMGYIVWCRIGLTFQCYVLYL